MTSVRIAAPIALLLAAASSPAQSVVVPNANENVRGTSQLNTLVRNSGNPRTYMVGINAGELGAIPMGSVINGVSFRFQVFRSNSPSWPATDAAWSDYQIFVGPAIPTASWTGNFMSNFSATPTMARSGPMVLPANTYTNVNPPAPTPNPWGEFYFDFQVPFPYAGGDLALLFSHPGSNQTTTAQYLETVASDAAAHGVAYSQAVYPVGSSGSRTTFTIPRVHYGFGTGCAGAGGFVPNLVQNANTTGGLGGTILLSLANAPASAPGFLAFGFGSPQIPLGNGCSLWTLPFASSLLLLDARGTGRVSIGIPAGVLGGFNVQALVLDAAGPGGFTTSNAVGPRAR